MNNYLALYLFTRIDKMIGIFGAIAVVSIMAIILFYIIRFVDSYDEDDEKEYDRRYGKVKSYAWPLMIISVLFLIFLPNQKDLVIIIAGGKTLDYVQSDTSLSKIPYQTTEIITKYLDEKVKEMSSKKETPCPKP